MDCCDIYADQFDREEAISEAQAYREGGLGGMARAMFGALTERGVENDRVHEFGGGVGGLSLELVKAGAASALNVELSASYGEAAAALALEAGLEDRVEFREGDAIRVAAEIGTADIVVMNRVVCCFAGGNELMDAAIAGTTRLLAVSFPTIHPASRIVFGVDNWWRARRGSEFRTFVHSRSTFARPEAAGLVRVHHRNRPIWSMRIWERREGA